MEHLLLDWLSRKTSRQKKFLIRLGLGLDSLQLTKNEYVGPNFEKGDVLSVKPDNFVEVVERMNIPKISAEAGRGDDSQVPYDLYALVNKPLDLYIKTGAVLLLYKKSELNEYERLFVRLYELGFKWDKVLADNKWTPNWSVLKRTI